ncbi:hypothetical protein [Lentzea sp. NPDC051838]|uniref:hypothetical protein n=1 Tax=Lentzea sp. NPDC051838 TaxID=3154849 RepID=UPI003425CFDC
MVIRTLTSLVRLQDVLPLIDADRRVMLRYTLDEGSRFTAGLRAHLTARNIPLISWAEASNTKFDLVLAAHTNASLAELDGPLIVMPHGAGYNRVLPSRTASDTVPVGLSRQELTSHGEVFPTVIGLSHERQIDQLRSSCPPAVNHAVVIGDPTWDRLVASRTRRDSYRRHLGVTADQRLVVISSTWDVNSLLGQPERLVERLVAQLPMDEFRVALVLHPNVWAHHGVNTILGWFRDCLDSGLMLIQPHDSWQATLIAADAVVGDHGSVSFYGAALGHPFLKAGNGLRDLAEESTTAAFMRGADPIDPLGDLRAQIESCFVTHDPGYFRAITAQALGRKGESWSVLRRVLYNLMALEPPASAPRMLPLNAPIPLRGNDVTACHVTSSLRDGRLQLERFPAVLEQFRRATDVEEYFLVADDEETDHRLRASAEIVIRSTPLPKDHALKWARTTLAECSGATVVAVATDDHCLVVLRSGEVLRSQDVLGSAAALYSWLATGGVLGDELSLELCRHGSTTQLTLRRLGAAAG